LATTTDPAAQDLPTRILTASDPAARILAAWDPVRTWDLTVGVPRPTPGLAAWDPATTRDRVAWDLATAWGLAAVRSPRVPFRTVSERRGRVLVAPVRAGRGW